MGKVIDLAGVRRGDAHLKRAKELNPNVTRRAVPIAGILSNDRLALTVPEVAQAVGLHPITVRREIRAGRLRAASAGGKGHYRISRADVEVWWRGRGGGGLFSDAVAAVSQAPTNPLAAALAMVQTRDAAAPKRAPRTTDAASDLEALRAERTDY